MDYLRVGTTDSNLSSVKCPSSLNWGKITVSDENAGRVKKNAKILTIFRHSLTLS